MAPDLRNAVASENLARKNVNLTTENLSSNAVSRFDLSAPICALIHNESDPRFSRMIAITGLCVADHDTGKIRNSLR